MVRGSKVRPFIVALDDEWSESKVWLKRLKGRVWGFKVGSILFSQKGPKVVEEIQKAGFRVFLDLKFHDIPNTVEGAVREAFKMGVNLCTVHACGGRQMLEAISPLQKKDQRLLAVTVLTSLDQKNLEEIGVERSLREQVASMAELAVGCGIKGLVSSPHEVSLLRQKFSSALLVTPGVRLQQAHDQKRVATPQQAIDDGADLLVIGRALTESKNWEKSWDELTSSLEGTSLKKRSA
mgnify:CR=1 FL=1